MSVEKVTDFLVGKSDCGTACVFFKINGEKWLEWIDYSRDGETIYLENQYSNVRIHYRGNCDSVIEQLEKFVDVHNSTIQN